MLRFTPRYAPLKYIYLIQSVNYLGGTDLAHYPISSTI